MPSASHSVSSLGSPAAGGLRGPNQERDPHDDEARTKSEIRTKRVRAARRPWSFAESASDPGRSAAPIKPTYNTVSAEEGFERNGRACRG